MTSAIITLIISFLISLPLLAQQSRPQSGELPTLGPVSVQSTYDEADPWDHPAPPGSEQIPSHETPIYYCLDGFFSLPVKVHMEHDDLDSLLEAVGVTPTLTLKSLVIQLHARVSSKSQRFSSMKQHAHDPVAWDDHQYTLIEREVSSFKVMYDDFLAACEEEGLDSELIHEEIVAFGRSTTSMGTSGQLHPRHKAALRIFEGEDTTNRWLTD